MSIDLSKYLLKTERDPEAWSFYKRQESCDWSAEEFSFVNDKDDYQSCNPRIKELLKGIFGFFLIGDGIISKDLIPMINEAIYALHEGVAEKEAIDQVMTLGMAHPMGPLRLADFIGLDVCLNIMNVLHKGFQDDKYTPCPLLREMVDKGHLGNKTGQGFYIYEV